MPKDTMLLKTGSTCLDLACSGSLEGGFRTGHYYLFVGDSDSGKTFLCLTCLAEACKDPRFDKYRLIYDAVEGGAIMDIERFFGKKVLQRLEPPKKKGKEWINSYTVEDFYYHLDDALKIGEPFIYILDSQDGLTSEAEVKKFGQRKRSTRGKETEEDTSKSKGSYGDAKAKVHSQNLRKVIQPLKDLGSILIIINQTRDSFDMFTPSTYSGGRALKFYATMQLWSSVGGQIKKTYRSKERQLGIRAKVRVKKNRMTGRDRSVVVPIYHSLGIDDVGGCVEYLCSEGLWKNKKGIIEVEGLGPSFSGRIDEVVKKIEEQESEDDVRELVAGVWQDIERAIAVKRKKRYE